MSAEDIAQNVFLKLYENLPGIQKKESINYWLFHTAKNEVYTYLRKKKSNVDQFNVDDTDEIEIKSEFDFRILIELKETKEIIMNELNKMPFEQKEVFILKEYGGLSYKEIASVMEIDENLVKSRLFKTRQKLINCLAKFESK